MICPYCGELVTSKDSPDKCPVCGAKLPSTNEISSALAEPVEEEEKDLRNPSYSPDRDEQFFEEEDNHPW